MWHHQCYVLVLGILKPRLILCNRLYNHLYSLFVHQRFYALVLFLRPRWISCDRLYNTLYRSFIATSYHGATSCATLCTGLWMQLFCSHEFTLEWDLTWHSAGQVEQVMHCAVGRGGEGVGDLVV